MGGFTFSAIWQNPAAEERLTELWNTGRHPLREIAAALSTEFGQRITKNAVLGKVERLGLRGTAKAVKAAVVEDSDGVAGDIGTITLSGGYAYRAGHLLRDGIVLEARQ